MFSPVRNTIDFSELVGDTTQFCKFIYGTEWFQGIPGGFVTNTPKRFVTTFGDGSPINAAGKLYGKGWDKTFWTAKMNRSNVSLHTKTKKLPDIFSKVVPQLRLKFKELYPDAVITDNTFSISVCNYYNEPDMVIAAHTDDNVWYPSECSKGSLFASFTFYPYGEPENEQDFARFQIKQDGKWQDVILKHNSVLFMPSNIEHRVLAYKKSNYSKFKPRVNITFRSTYTRKHNPLMNYMAVANHTRYYRIPYAISYPDTIDRSIITDIVSAYNIIAVKYKYNKLKRIKYDTTSHAAKRKELILLYRTKFNDFKVTSNMVTETFMFLFKHIK